MRTDKQIAASRANGSLSRGPLTPEGKARSSRNSTKHGLLARALLLEGESRARFEEIVRDLTSTLKPATPVEDLLIGKMAAAHWRQIRAWAVEKQTGRSLSDHEGRLDRQFFRALTQYQRLKNFFAETNPQPIEFEPKNPASEPDNPEKPGVSGP